MKRTISLLLALCVCLSFSGLYGIRGSAASYDASAAASYSYSHYNDGVGLCAQFVSNCLNAGGCSAYSTVVSTLQTQLKNGNWGTLYKLAKSGQEVKSTNNAGKVSVGDPIFFYCTKCGAWPHVAIVCKIDASGIVYCNQHNPAMTNMHWLATYSHCSQYADVYCFHMTSHTHSYSRFSYNQGTHPHYAVYECSCGATQVSSETAYSSSCRICNIPSAPTLSVTATNSAASTVLRWNSCTRATEYDIYIYKDDTKYITSYGEGSTNYSVKLPAGHYKAQVAAVNTHFSECYIFSNTVSFTVAAATYTLSYNANGGTGAPAAQSGNTTYTIPSTIPVRSGYSFLGWATSSYATTAAYKPSGSITISQNTTLYAVWSKITYTLSYNANGGTGAPAAQSGNTTYAIPSDVPTRPGYTFLGWGTSASATTASYKPSGSITISQNTTLYAVWSKITYTLSYNANGGTGAPAVQSGNTTYTIPSTIPVRSGYSFLGWATSSYATTAAYKPSGSITISQNTTLYAVWLKNTPVGTFSVDKKEVSFAAGSTATITCTCTGYANKNLQINALVQQDSILSGEWRGWINSQDVLTLAASKEGSESVELRLCDADTGEILAVQTVQVTVTAQKTTFLQTLLSFPVLLFEFLIMPFVFLFGIIGGILRGSPA